MSSHYLMGWPGGSAECGGGGWSTEAGAESEVTSSTWLRVVASRYLGTAGVLATGLVSLPWGHSQMVAWVSSQLGSCISRKSLSKGHGVTSQKSQILREKLAHRQR